eukprot:5587659-Amphidinium_carterae.1
MLLRCLAKVWRAVEPPREACLLSDSITCNRRGYGVSAAYGAPKKFAVQSITEIGEGFGNCTLGLVRGQDDGGCGVRCCAPPHTKPLSWRMCRQDLPAHP